MKSIYLVGMIHVLVALLSPRLVLRAAEPITVASYYFGNYHPGDPRNTRMKGATWSEWELVKAAKPRFPGHQQPKVPLWGYLDESDAKVMARKIAAAADHGIDAFMAVKMFGVPYFPNVSMGWDPSPRAAQEDAFGDFGYPFTNTIGNNTPENFRTALEKTKERLLAQPGGPRILNLNCWNEWTEGSYLEPDTVHGSKYLEAVRSVFGGN
jgi:hypothetical protein